MGSFVLAFSFNNCGTSFSPDNTQLQETTDFESPAFFPDQLGAAPEDRSTPRTDEPGPTPMTSARVFVHQTGSDLSSGLTEDRPLQSLSRAIEVARRQLRAHDKVTIFLSGGYHFVRDTIQIHGFDLGANQSLTIKSLPGQVAFISGARAVRPDWKPVSWRSNVYAASVPGENFRQLYLRYTNGAVEKATRARWPKVNWYNPGDGVQVKGYLLDQKNLILDASKAGLPGVLGENRYAEGIEFHQPFRWMRNTFRLDYFFTTNEGAYIASPMNQEKWTFFRTAGAPGFPATSYGDGEKQFGWFENSPLYVSEGNDWAFDNTNKILYLYAQTGLSDVLIPNRLEQLLSIQASKNVTFENVVFGITDDLQTEKSGFVLQGWRHQRPDGTLCTDEGPDCVARWTGYEQRRSAAIDLGLTDRISFRNCGFYGFARDGISFGYGGMNTNTLIENSSFNSIAGSALNIILAENLSVRNNTFASIGIETGLPALVANPLFGGIIENNSFWATSAYAILIFGDQTRGVHVRRNRVEYALLYQVDAGAINTSGVRSPSAVHIYENYIKNTVKSGWDAKGGGSPAIYLDEGSNQVWVYNNVVENASIGFLENGPRNHLVRGNYFHNVETIRSAAYAVNRQAHSYPAIQGLSEQAVIACTLAGSCPTDSVFMENDGSIASAGAQAIIEGAGRK